MTRAGSVLSMLKVFVLFLQLTCAYAQAPVTVSPSTAPTPSIAPSPGISPCYICNGDLNGVITNPQAIVNFPTVGDVTCFDLDFDFRSGVPVTFCSIVFQIRPNVTETCGCVYTTGTTAPVTLSVKPTTAPTANPQVITISPTKVPIPAPIPTTIPIVTTIPTTIPTSIPVPIPTPIPLTMPTLKPTSTPIAVPVPSLAPPKSSAPVPVPASLAPTTKVPLSTPFPTAKPIPPPLPTGQAPSVAPVRPPTFGPVLSSIPPKPASPAPVTKSPIVSQPFPVVPVKSPTKIPQLVPVKTNQPSIIIKSVAPQTDQLRTCYICVGDSNASVSPEAYDVVVDLSIIGFMGVPVSCEDLERDALDGLLTENECSQIIAATATIAVPCQCTNVADATSEPTVVLPLPPATSPTTKQPQPSIPEPKPVPAPKPAPVPVTLDPLRVCYICRGDPEATITNPQVILDLGYLDIPGLSQVSCKDLDASGRSRMFTVSECQTILDVGSLISTPCGCVQSGPMQQQSLSPTPTFPPNKIMGKMSIKKSTKTTKTPKAKKKKNKKKGRRRKKTKGKGNLTKGMPKNVT